MSKTIKILLFDSSEVAIAEIEYRLNAAYKSTWAFGGLFFLLSRDDVDVVYKRAKTWVSPNVQLCVLPLCAGYGARMKNRVWNWLQQHESSQSYGHNGAFLISFNEMHYHKEISPLRLLLYNFNDEGNAALRRAALNDFFEGVEHYFLMENAVLFRSDLSEEILNDLISPLLEEDAYWVITTAPFAYAGRLNLSALTYWESMSQCVRASATSESRNNPDLHWMNTWVGALFSVSLMVFLTWLYWLLFDG